MEDCKNQRAADAMEKLRAKNMARFNRRKAERKPAMFICSTPDGDSGPWYDSIAGLSVDGKRRKEMMEKEYGVTISPDHWALFEDVSADFNKRMAPWSLPMSTDYTIHGFNIMPGPVTDTAVPEASRAARYCGNTAEAQKLLAAAVLSQLGKMVDSAGKDHTVESKSTCLGCDHADYCMTSEFASRCPDFIETQGPTCKDCANQDESQAPTGTEGITFCRAQGVNVPLSTPACGNFIQIPDKSKSEVVTECENDTPRAIHEEAKTIAETVSDLYYQIASLDSQKDSLIAANKELLDLSKNCPECEEYCEIADTVEKENAALRDHNNRLVKDLLAAKSWKVGMEARLAHRGDTIRNLQARIQGEAKEIDILKSSLRAAESALRAKENELGQLRAYVPSWLK